MRLFIFAIISEIPFDLAFYNKIFYLNYQNVFFTLFLGLLNINIIKKINSKLDKNKKTIKIIINIIVISIFCIIAILLKTDYKLQEFY